MARQVRFLSSLGCLTWLCLGSCSPSTQAGYPLQNLSAIQLDTRGGITYVDSLPYSGTVFHLFPTGDTSEIRGYLHGKEHGLWKQYYASGKLREIRYFEHGKKEGLYKSWWENGLQKAEYPFKNDEYEGICQEWSPEGTLERRMTYQAGHEEGWQQVWYPNGKLKSNYLVIHGRRYGLLGTKNCINVSDSLLQAGR